MTDDVIVSSGTVTFRQNLWKRLVGLGASVLFVLMGAALAFMPIDPADANVLVTRIIGYGAMALAVFGAYAAFTKSRTVLVVSPEGVMPSYLAPEFRTLIPWSNIDRFGEAVATMKGNKMKYLAVYLRTPQQFMTPMQKAADNAFAAFVSDGGIADLYIPEMMLPLNVQKAIAQLEALRPKTS